MKCVVFSMDKVLTMIGMAKRAGKIVTGAEICEAAVRKRKTKLIIIAGDISENGRKAITDACKYYKTKYIEYSDKENLGKFTGSESRSVIAVNDRGFAESILKKYAEIFDRKE